MPDDDAADIDAGWDDYYLGPIKALKTYPISVNEAGDLLLMLEE